MIDISISDELDALRSRLNGCRLAAFADISTKMVLRVSADPKPRQEEIEAMCDLAAGCLDSKSLPTFFDGEAPFTAVVAGKTESQFFIRSLTDPSDALIVIVAEPVEQTQVWAAAQDLLDHHSDDGATS